MTEARRKLAAVCFREMLDDPKFHERAVKEGKKPRALAIAQVCAAFSIDRATLYRYCKRFAISTR